MGENDIAIVGMAARLPGAPNIQDYWANLKGGIRSIRRLSDDELRAAGEAPHIMNRDDYVPFAAPLEGFDQFDAEFFGFSPKDAAIMDPQHRQFLEVSWEALENAGHMPENFDGPVGVYAGCGMGSYFYFNICSNPGLVADTGMFLLRHTGNDKDFLATRLSHILDLKGPSISVQTACSTSLVAVHYAAQSLLNGECDMALAGGVTIELPQNRGYQYKPGEVLSPDGACHAFDHRAEGTVFGSGAGVVVLRRLEDAIADGDHIWAVIKGSAVNNDGAAKAGYLAPSVDGQAAAIAEAQAVAGISAETVGYVECHGTGTYLGDPIEVAALDDAFRRTSDAVGTTRLGSVKTNIGHLDTAAGVAGLIKTSLSLHHKIMPPSLGYEKPNPAIDFEGSPFIVNDTLTEWEAKDHPRRAGVNALGVGGTNAHIVLEEAPMRPVSEAADWPFMPIILSARSRGALDDASENMAQFLEANTDISLADIAYTLKQGRRAFDRRRVIVAESHADAAAQLRAADPRRVFNHSAVSDAPEVVFMFPGGGAQYQGMARDLYETEPVFQEWMDQGLALLAPKLTYDIRALWLPEPGAEDAAAKRLLAPSVQLPLIMICEYALAQLWMSWGVTPSALIGHSMGENTAACLAGTMTFEACIGLVHLRGVLMDGVEKGGMLSVALPAKELQAYLGDALDLAVVNGPSLSVASGAVAGLDALQKRLEEQGIDCQRIAIDIAAHSRLLDPILEEFGGYLRGMDLKAPQIPIISNRTGIALTDAEAMDPDYWIGHLRGTVRFADGLTTLSENPERIYIEVGPGKALSSLAGQHDKLEANQVTSSLRHQKDVIADDAYFMTMLARVWAMGGHIDWAQIWGEARRNRVVLPSYPFQHQTYFIEPGQAVSADESEWLMRVDDRDQWGWQPGWQPEYAKCNIDVSGDLSDMPVQNWLIFNDDAGVAAPMVERLRKAGQNVTSVTTGDAFARLSDDTFVLAPERGREGYDQLIAELTALGRLPQRIAHFWLVTADEKHRPGGSFFHRVQEQGFWSLFYLMQALAAESADSDLHLLSVTSGAMQVRDERLAYPSKATIAGPIRVIPREFPDVTSSQLDIELGPKGKLSAEQAEALLEELLAEPANVTAALRGNRRYRLGWKRAALDFDAQLADLPLKQGATVLLTGGFGGIGLTVAQALISRYRANIVLIGRQELPERDEWSNYLRNVAPNDRVARRIRAVQGLEEAGGQVLTLAADVSNIEEMRAAVAKAEDRFGQISGVVHGAGVIDDAPILAKTSMGIEDVFTPKIHGTQVIDALFADGTLDFLALFSSSSTATAPAGQVDYVAANEYLNGFAKARAGFKTKVVAINWGIWNGVGMAAEAMQARTSRAAPPQKPVDQPLLDFAGFDDAGNRIFAATWQADKNWVLNEHRVLSGDALLPGTGYLELAAEALAAQGEHGPFEVLDLTFLQPLRADDGVETAVRVTLPRTNTGYSFSVQSAGPGAAMGLNAEAELSLLPLARPDRLDIDEIAARLAAPLAAPTGGSLRSPQEAHLRFGPRWNVLQETRLGKGEGLARLRLPLAAQGDSAYALHPGLLDLATGWAMELIEGYEAKNLWVPVSYGSVRVYGPLPADLVSYVKITQNAASGSDFATFSIVLAAPDGAVALEADGFTIRRLDGALRFGAASPANAVSDGPIPLSAAEERLQHNLSQGISADEGASAFFAALGAGRSQIVVTSLDLPALIAQAEASGQSNADTGQSFERPELDNDFAAPETDIEKRLAGFWQELLGLAQVGIDDSFFDLGGHSLIAVRLFAMVKKGYAVDFPISILFEAPTIRKCAALIAAQGGTDTAEAAPQGAAPARPASRFTHLVPMHQGEGGSKTPFFLVAGMFGNVLNLRHLAHLLGADRPFYGLQARGLLGEEQPHTSLVGAARDMIVEIKAVQAQGPYMVGGFSGGGITAYEIARQLKEAGDETSVLVMLDTPLPIRQPLSRADRAAIQWAEAKAGGIAYPFNWAIRRVRWEFEKRKVKTDEGSAAPQFHNAAIEAAFLGAIDAYQLQDWDGPLTLLRPPLVGKWEVAPGRWVNDERAYVLPDNDWTSHAPKIEVFEVPGDHDSMVLEPNVRVLAARMRHVIEAAETARLPSRLARWSQKKAAE